MAISETKFALERQRVNDVVSFPTYIAHGNTFNEELDYAPISRFPLLRAMYAPLFEILGISLLGVFLRLLLRLVLARVGAWVTSVRAIRRRAAKIRTAPVPEGSRRLAWVETVRSVPGAESRGIGYRRAAVEKLLNIPMRARSIVRPPQSMEKLYNGEVLLISGFLCVSGGSRRARDSNISYAQSHSYRCRYPRPNRPTGRFDLLARTPFP